DGSRRRAGPRRRRLPPGDELPQPAAALHGRDGAEPLLPCHGRQPRGADQARRPCGRGGREGGDAALQRARQGARQAFRPARHRRGDRAVSDDELRRARGLRSRGRALSPRRGRARDRGGGRYAHHPRTRGCGPASRRQMGRVPRQPSGSHGRRRPGGRADGQRGRGPVRRRRHRAGRSGPWSSCQRLRGRAASLTRGPILGYGARPPTPTGAGMSMSWFRYDFMTSHKLIAEVESRGRAMRVAGALQDLIEPPPDALTVFEHTAPDTPTTLWRIEAYFSDARAPDTLEAALSELLDEPAPTFQSADIPDLNWVALSQAALPPVNAGRFTVHGGHDKDRVPQGPNAILIEAGE